MFNDSPQLGTWRQLVPVSGLAAIALGALTITPSTPYPGTAALLPVSGSLLLIASSPQAWVNRVLLANRGMVMVGLISYPLYLWHWPILSFMRIVHTEAPPTGMRWLAVGLSFLLAWLTFRFIETPIRFGARRTAKLAGVGTAVVCAASGGILIQAGHGVPARLPKQATSLMAYQYDYQEAYREGTCFLRPEQSAEEFSQCKDQWPSGNGGWLLWGDSHAAHLYPGLVAHQGADAGIVQRTASGCPPLAGESVAQRPHCEEIRRQIWQEIESHRPQRVTLAARWDLYDWRKISDTVQRLKLLGVRDIELVGPVPQWHNGLPRQVAIVYRENGFATIPVRLNRGYLATPIEIDRQMRTFARSMQVEYISPIETFCSRDGCLTRNPLEGGGLVAWDDAHLTTMGSVLLTSKWP